MTLFLIFGIILVIGIISILIGHDLFKKYTYTWEYNYENYYIVGFICLIISGVVLPIMIVNLALKPVVYKNFKIKYDTIKEMSTSPDDVRDATYTQNLIEINNEIRHCQEYKNSTWVGIFQNKKICNLKLLNK